VSSAAAVVVSSPTAETAMTQSWAIYARAVTRLLPAKIVIVENADASEHVVLKLKTT
jgi:hypothetical protein